MHAPASAAIVMAIGMLPVSSATAKHGNRRDGRNTDRKSVQTVNQVYRIRDADNPDNRDRHRQNAEMDKWRIRQRIQIGEQTNLQIADADRNGCRHNLHHEFELGAERQHIIENAECDNDGRSEQDAQHGLHCCPKIRIEHRKPP